MDKKTLIFIGLGLELPGLILACVFLGKFIDERYGLKGMAIAGGALIGLIAWVTHLFIVIKTQESKDEAEPK